jgi:hypothetical protein
VVRRARCSAGIIILLPRGIGQCGRRSAPVPGHPIGGLRRRIPTVSGSDANCAKLRVPQPLRLPSQLPKNRRCRAESFISPTGASRRIHRPWICRICICSSGVYRIIHHCVFIIFISTILLIFPSFGLPDRLRHPRRRCRGVDSRPEVSRGPGPALPRRVGASCHGSPAPPRRGPTPPVFGKVDRPITPRPAPLALACLPCASMLAFDREAGSALPPELAACDAPHAGGERQSTGPT